MRAGCGSKKMAQNHPVVVDEIDIAYALGGYQNQNRTGLWLDGLEQR